MEVSDSKSFYSLKPKPQIGQISPLDTFEGCRQKLKANRDQGSMQAHKSVSSLSMDIPFLKIERRIFDKASQKKQPIHFHSTFFYQAGNLDKHAKQDI